MQNLPTSAKLLHLAKISRKFHGRASALTAALWYAQLIRNLNSQLILNLNLWNQGSLEIAPESRQPFNARARNFAFGYQASHRIPVKDKSTSNSMNTRHKNSMHQERDVLRNVTYIVATSTCAIIRLPLRRMRYPQ